MPGHAQPCETSTRTIVHGNGPRRNQYARGVVRELRNGREAQTRTWRLDVYENSEKRVFAITFASLDETLAHLQPELRVLVEGLCERDRRLREATQSAVRESRARLPRSRGKPYLITNLGKRTIIGASARRLDCRPPPAALSGAGKSAQSEF